MFHLHMHLQKFKRFAITYYIILCLTISYASTPAATEAFRESILPFIGMDAVKSHFSFMSLPTPSPSFPMTRPIGPLRFCRYIISPSMSAQTNHKPSFLSSSMVAAMLVTFATGVYSMHLPRFLPRLPLIRPLFSSE